jgi:hypothetical protein
MALRLPGPGRKDRFRNSREASLMGPSRVWSDFACRLVSEMIPHASHPWHVLAGKTASADRGTTTSPFSSQIEPSGAAPSRANPEPCLPWTGSRCRPISAAGQSSSSRRSALLTEAFLENSSPFRRVLSESHRFGGRPEDDRRAQSRVTCNGAQWMRSRLSRLAGSIGLAM